jgi:tetratricopeptide (TPR) repeat protein
VPEVCSKCGVPEGVGCALAEEASPLLRRRLYCPRCLERYHLNFLLMLVVLAVVMAVLGAWIEISRGRSALRSPLVFVALLSFFQWFMIIPHELGHAISARLLGFQNIRLLIGAGRPVATFELFSFKWLINSHPFGGLTLCDLPPNRERWRFVFMVAAGPAVSVIAMTAAYVFREDASVWPRLTSIAGVIFWANAVVLADNLIPMHINAFYGPMANDGLLILQLLGWKKTEAVLNTDLSGPNRFKRILRWIGVVIVGLGAMLFFALTVFVVRYLEFTLSPGIVIGLGLFLFIQGIVLSVMTWRLARSSSRSHRKTDASMPIATRAFQELIAGSVLSRQPALGEQLDRLIHAATADECLAFIAEKLSTHPADPALLFVKADREAHAGRHADVEQTLRLIPRDALPHDARWLLAATEVRAVYNQHDFPRAEQLCENWLAADDSAETKIAFLDHFICLSLFSEDRPHVASMEKWARRALELGPQNLTIHGTLGHILVELGRDAEAEPFLQNCLNSSALHDKGISSYCLALIREREGKTPEALRLLQQALIYFDAPWFVARIKAKLAQISRVGSSELT